MSPAAMVAYCTAGNEEERPIPTIEIAVRTYARSVRCIARQVPYSLPASRGFGARSRFSADGGTAALSLLETAAMGGAATGAAVRAATSEGVSV